jgi:hypothetical protein
VITQDSILNLIRKQEADIQTLLETKSTTNDETLQMVTEVKVLDRQQFITDLRGLI